MGVPTEQELERALSTAKTMRESGEDKDFLAKTLLNHHYRLNLLHHVMEAAGLYLHSGNGSKEHARLLKAIEKAKAAEYRPGQDDHHENDIVI